MEARPECRPPRKAGSGSEGSASSPRLSAWLSPALIATTGDTASPPPVGLSIENRDRCIADGNPPESRTMAISVEEPVSRADACKALTVGEACSSILAGVAEVIATVSVSLVEGVV